MTALTDEKNLGRLEAVCRRCFGSTPEADECYVYVLDKCREDDFRRLRAFSRRSSLATFLYTLFNNLIFDFKREKFGRKRIPELVRRLGAWAEAVYKLVCWQRYSYDDAWEIVTLDNLYGQAFNQFLADIEKLHQAPCSENPSFFSIDDESQRQNLVDETVGGNPMAAFLAKLDRQKRLHAARVIRGHLATLEAQDKLLIRLIYGDNHSIAAAARVLGLYQVQAQRRLNKLLIGFKEALLKEGITGL